MASQIEALECADMLAALSPIAAETVAARLRNIAVPLAVLVDCSGEGDVAYDGETAIADLLALCDKLDRNAMAKLRRP